MPVLLVVGGCAEAAYRHDCLARAAARHPVALIVGEAPTWERDHIVDHEVADLADEKAVLAAAKNLAQRQCIAGVLTWDEYLLVPTAKLARLLGVPGNSPQAMVACRDKHRSRRLFARQEIPSAASTRVTRFAEARKAAEAIGFPVVLKPASHAGSVGVIRVDRPEDLRRAWKYAFAGAQGQGAEGSGVLVEEYLDGKEISVECVTEDGHTTAVAVTRKSLTDPPYFEETGHTVAASDPLLDEVAPVAVRALAALGVSHGVSHVEMRLTTSGPRVIEVNARLAGDMIPRLVELATGIDLVAAAVDVALGAAPRLARGRSRSAAIRIFYPPATGNLTQRRLDPAAARAPWLERFSWQAALGEPVAPPPHTAIHTSRLGFAIVTGRTPAHTRQYLDRISDRTVITVTPAPRSERSAA